MKEIVTVQFGKFGNTLGTLFWEDLSYEHQVSKMNRSSISMAPESGLNIFFDENLKGNFTPRTVLIDPNPGSIEILRNEIDLFEVPDYAFVTGSKSNDMNYSVGFKNFELIENSLEACRKLAEKCEVFQGYQFFHSIGGGTGSGVMSALMEELLELDCAKLFFTFTCCPTKKISELPLEFINAGLAFKNLIDLGSVCIMLDNEKLLQPNLDVQESVNFHNLNQIMRKQVSDFTSLLRFPSSSLTSYLKIRNFLSVYPRMHFVDISSSYQNPNSTSDELVTQTLTEESMYYNEDLKNPQAFASIGISRGNICQYKAQKDLNIWSDENFGRFDDWIPRQLKYHYAKTPHKDCEYSFSYVKNSANLKNLIGRISQEFSNLIQNSELTNLYTQNGLENLCFTEAEENLKDLYSEYEYWAINTVADEP